MRTGAEDTRRSRSIADLERRPEAPTAYINLYEAEDPRTK